MIWYLANCATKTNLGPLDQEGGVGSTYTGPVDDADEPWVSNGERYVIHAYDGVGNKCLVGFYSTPTAVPSSCPPPVPSASRATRDPGRRPAVRAPPP